VRPFNKSFHAFINRKFEDFAHLSLAPDLACLGFLVRARVYRAAAKFAPIFLTYDRNLVKFVDYYCHKRFSIDWNAVDLAPYIWVGMLVNCLLDLV